MFWQWCSYICIREFSELLLIITSHFDIVDKDVDKRIGLSDYSISPFDPICLHSTIFDLSSIDLSQYV